jgi:hypothetical protein
MTMQRWTVLFVAHWLAIGSIATGAEAVVAGADNPDYKAVLYRPASEPREVKEPLRLGPGPHLFLDDYLIGTSDGVVRRVNSPARDPKLGPIITGKEDKCFQPYMSVVRDPETKQFRIWYGAYRADQNQNRSCLATMESDDAIHWKRPTRLLDDPAPIQFGSCVLDEGPGYRDPANRYKYVWWMHEGKSGGMWLAGSPDGFTFKLLSPHVVLHHNHDINNIFWDSLRKHYVATISVWREGPTWKGERRTTMQSTSNDLLNWEKPWFILTPDDKSDPPETQFYAMQGHLIRGDLWIGLVKILHDNFRAEGTPDGSYGIGHTQLAWTRDGQTWFRDQTPYFEPDPTPGAWDHAHAWMDFQLPVGDEVYIYYGGYKNGHKVNRFEERQIGLVRIPRDRYVSRDADAKGGTLTTPPVILEGSKLTVNAHVGGDMRLRLLDEAGKPIPGFDAADCQPIQGDGVALPVQWKGSLDTVKGKPVRIEFQMKDAQLYAFDLAE